MHGKKSKKLELKTETVRSLDQSEMRQAAGGTIYYTAACASTVLTSNKGFEDWGQVLGDDVMAAALIDRLVHHCHIVNIRGNSFRMRHHTELSKALLADLEADKPSPGRRRRRTKEAATT